MKNRVYTKVIYNVSIKAVQKVNDNTELITKVVDLSETVSGTTVFNPYVAENKVVRLANSMKEELERVDKLEEKVSIIKRGGS